MFSHPAPPSRDVEEGTVIQVDPIQSLCKVKTLRGQMLTPVQWILPIGGSTRGGDRVCPHVGDRVVLSFGLGSPVIIGFLPKLQLEEGSSPVSISSGEVQVDTGNYSPMGRNTQGDQNKPRDFMLGDRVMTSFGGGMLGLLRSGTVILRSSRVSEIVLSKFDSLVRIVSRNWEHYSDVCSDVIRNYKGAVYRYTGYTQTLANSKVEEYQYHLYYGNTSTAEAVKTGYRDTEVAATSGPVVFKEQVTDRGGVEGTSREIARRTVNLSGEQEVWIFNGETFTRVISTAGELNLSWNRGNDKHYLSIAEASIHARHKDGADLVLDSAGVRATFQDGKVDLSSGSVKTTFGSNEFVVNASGVTGTAGAGTFTARPSETSIRNGGHQVVVTAGGVAIS